MRPQTATSQPQGEVEIDLVLKLRGSPDAVAAVIARLHTTPGGAALLSVIQSQGEHVLLPAPEIARRLGVTQECFRQMARQLRTIVRDGEGNKHPPKTARKFYYLDEVRAHVPPR